MIVDCAVHPVVASDDEFRSYLEEPWRSGKLPAAVDRGLLRSEFPWNAEGTDSQGGLPASDPAIVRAELMATGKADTAILLPLTRGLLPNIRREVAVAAATNDWLAATWLSRDNPDGRFKGSIRIAPRSAPDAIQEIERWADHPHFVQVAVPLQAHVPYGHEQYLPIWQAAAKHRLPVVIHDDGGGVGDELAPTTVGNPTHFVEAFALRPFNAAIHLASLICEGVFERLDDLVVVLADGGFDAVWSLLWRLDKDWKAARSDIPWTQRQPSHYVPEHVRFVLGALDGPSGPDHLAAAFEIWDADRLLMYGSHYPHWDYFSLEEAAHALPDAGRERILGGNAADVYGLAGSTTMVAS